jgi:hypothetical protein
MFRERWDWLIELENDLVFGAYDLREVAVKRNGISSLGKQPLRLNG